MPASRRYYSRVDDDRKGTDNWKRYSRWAKQRKFLLLFIAATLVALLYLAWPKFPKQSKILSVSDMADISKKSLTTRGNKFYLNDRPFRILSGSIHYFRVPRAYWRDRLSKLKAAGLNTVDTYVAWNMHEEQRGQFDFSGNLDLVKFLSIAHELGLYVILRPGPYICAEWDWGGLPPWLLLDPKMKIRTTYEGYTSAVEAYFSELFRRVSPLQYSKSGGGPIIAVQIENEYGAYGDDKAYMSWLKNLLIQNGIVEFLFTSDGPEDLERGYLPGIYETVNYNEKTEEALAALEKFQPNKPLMTAEFWPGWFDHWFEKHHVLLADDLMRRLEPSFKKGASINFYMFHGGTNFGFMNGANLIYESDKKKRQGVLKRLVSSIEKIFSSTSVEYAIYKPTITSYDYDAPLNEFGGKTEKYEKLRQLIQLYQTEEEKKFMLSADPWSNFRPPKSYGQFKVQSWLSLTDALETVQPLPIELEKLLFVEQLQTEGSYQLYYGYVVYRKTIPWKNAKKIELNGILSDRMQVIVNGITVATFYSNHSHASFHEVVDLTSVQVFTNGDNVKDEMDLILLVENMGRGNFVRWPHKLDGMYKGFNGTVSLSNPGSELVMLNNWKVYSIRFKTAGDLQKMVLASTAKSQWKGVEQLNLVRQPAFYKIEFDVPNTDMDFSDDTFVNMTDWTKGVIYANGVNLGRYWNVGPQKALYLPGPWLKKGSKNEFIIFETDKPSSSVTLQAQPELGEPCPLPCYL